MGERGYWQSVRSEGTVQAAAVWLSGLMLLCRQDGKRPVSHGGAGSAVHNLWECSRQLAQLPYSQTPMGRSKGSTYLSLLPGSLAYPRLCCCVGRQRGCGPAHRERRCDICTLGVVQLMVLLCRRMWSEQSHSVSETWLGPTRARHTEPQQSTPGTSWDLRGHLSRLQTCDDLLQLLP